MRVHQMHFALIPGDAISNHILDIDARLRDWGLETSIYAGHIAPELASSARPEGEYGAHLNASEDLLIYHYGLYSPGIRYFQATHARKVLVYHNITPARYFQGWSREQAMLCAAGRRALPGLARCDMALGDSEFNRQELVRAGFDETRTAVLPIFVPRDRLDALPVYQSLLARLRSSGAVNFLTVGRIVPSKAVEDVIRIFAVYHRTINPNSRLLIVGSRYLPHYDAALDALVADLHLGDVVTFTGLVSDTDLKTYYQAADLYLHASHHEGFCVPLLESMHFGVPILARKAGAVPETLGNAGLLFTQLGYEEVAEMGHLLLTEEALRARVIAMQRERLADFAPQRVEAKLKGILQGLGILPFKGGNVR
ncbi:MAG: glycosyltransferase [Anaerolineae bacterium]|nr:glycosyltransferase [Anaerolineae bacterium]